MKFFILVAIKFFFISALFIISNGDLNLREQADRAIFIDAYSIWIDNVVDQGSEIGGYVANSQWLPLNDYSEGELATGSG
ncbi:MAG: hypothetical protein KKB79_00665 [Nanoarchaeota archaeon]|nr:hypothetical protein [Nanoarchaeota archaeon]